MLSLSPRYDLIRFSFPKDFLPKEVDEKYRNIVSKDPNVITTPIDYLNESIQSVTIPGISDINVTQVQHSSNSIGRLKNKINVEPKTDITYTSTVNPLDKIDKTFKVTFRMNQGLFNYYMLYETIFYRICKPFDYGPDPILYVEMLNEDGTVVSRVKFFDVYIDGIDGLEFTFNKQERDSQTFDISFKFNNIDFEIL